MESHTGVEACAAQAPGQLRGVDDRGPIVDPQSASVGGRRDLRAHGLGIERVNAISVRSHRLGDLDELGVLPFLGRHVEHAGSLEIAVDVTVTHRRLDGIEVLDTEPFEGVELGGKPAEAVGKTVCQAGVAESAVAAGGGRPGAACFEYDNVERRVPFSGEQRGPQAGESSADDREVALDVTVEARLRLRRLRVVEPEHGRLGVAEGRVARRIAHRRHLPRAPRARTR